MTVAFAAAAQGNAFAGAGIGAYENRIISRPTVFPFARGVGLMGEGQNPEGVLPLKRTKSGDLGVQVAGDAGGGGTQVILNNPVFQDMETQRRTMEQIATVITMRVAPNAVLSNYNNDGPIRNMVRGAY
jgi:phage-related minor tail protein